MNGPDHYREAERLRDEANSRGDFNPRAEWCLELAKLHTALAHVAITAQASDLRKGQQACVLNPRLRVDAVGDWPAVAGDGWWLGVDLVGEQGEGPREAGFGGGLGGDGGRGWGGGGGSGEAAHDGWPGGGGGFLGGAAIGGWVGGEAVLGGLRAC